jgi:hypothetical protein
MGGIAVAVLTGRRFSEHRYETAKNHAKGKAGLFLQTFPKTRIKGKKRRVFVVTPFWGDCEAVRSIALAIKGCAKKPLAEKTLTNKIIAEAKIGFTENAVIVECLQGRSGQQEWLERFRQVHGKPWANYLLAQIESHAKKCGFATVKIRIPESLRAYWTHEKTIRQRIEALHNNAANAMGYKRKGLYFVKEL